MPFGILLLTCAVGLDSASALRHAAYDRMAWCTSAEEYMNGSWVSDPSPDIQFPYTVEPEPKGRPVCDKTQREVLAGGPLPSYIRVKWKPNTCDMETFDPLAFCRSLDGQTIGVIGDSTQQSFALSLVGLVEGHANWNLLEFKWPEPTELCTKYGHTVHLLFKRADWYPHSQQDFDDLASVLNRSDVAILNWGVHLTYDGDVGISVGAELSDSPFELINVGAEHSQVFTATGPGPKNIKEVIQTYWSPKQMSRLFWRPSIAYHWNCDKWDGMFLSANEESIQTARYHSNDVYTQERTIVWPVMQDLGVTLLRSDAMMMLRQDGHRIVSDYGVTDCLHYCEPGPQDTWVHLFFHHLMGHIGA